MHAPEPCALSRSRRRRSRRLPDRSRSANVSFENEANERGQRLIWLDRAVVDRLRAMRGPGESYSDVILRLAKETTPTRRTKVK